MITRRNWVLRCSILINIAVALYICSHVMIGSGNMALGPQFIIQEDYGKQTQALRQHAVASLLQGVDDVSNYDQAAAAVAAAQAVEKEAIQVSFQSKVTYFIFFLSFITFF